MRQILLACLAVCLGVGATKVGAHPADISSLLVKLEPHDAELRFTFNLWTLMRIVEVDADRNHFITMAELEKVVPVVQAFLKKSVLVSVNDADVDVGEAAGFECVWPVESAGSDSAEAEWAGRFVDFKFRLHSKPVIVDYWLGFEVFDQLGDLHVVQAVYQQKGQPPHPVEFSVREPEYLYDTGFDPQAFEAPPAADAASAAGDGASSGSHGNGVVWAVGIAGLAAAVAIGLRRRRSRHQSGESAS